ncbi:MAG: hypothetical protein ACKO1N_00960 [Erythrobacter sp.]
MSRVATAQTGPARSGHGWQLILADLALILFLLTLSALPGAEANSDAPQGETRGPAMPEVAPAQALFRPVPGRPGIAAWLASQTPDPRATLTIFTVHRPGGEAAAWARAQALAGEAVATGARVRTIIMAGAEADLYASLAYDTQIAEAPEPSQEG